LPLIVFHAGFAFRGALTGVLMVLLVIVVVSGILGAVLQHYLPRMMTTRVPMETIYEEIPHVRAQLRDEAEQLVGTLAVEAEHDDKVRFREIYASSIRPYLEAPRRRHPRFFHRCAERRRKRFIQLLRIWRISAKRNASSAASGVCTIGFTPGCWYMFRSRLRC